MRDCEVPETLVEFAFESRAADLAPCELLMLARHAWKFNARMGLSGEMRLERGRFRQVVEGPSEIVQGLAARILGDRRHGSIRIIALRRLAARRFADWTMHGFPAPGAGTRPAISAANLHSIPSAGRPMPAAGFANS